MWRSDDRRRDASSGGSIAPGKYAPIKADPGGFPQRRISEVPIIHPEQLQAIHRQALESYHLDVLQLSETAGRAAAQLALAMFGGRGRGQRVLVLAGSGSRGAAGLAAVRHLANWNFSVRAVLGGMIDEFTPVARRQIEILKSVGLHGDDDNEDSELGLRHHLDSADLVIDALAGYGLAGPPAGVAAAAAEMVAGAGRPVLSLDVPTGINSATGASHEPSIKAIATMLLDLPKPGVLVPECRSRVGELYLADRGVPHVLYERAGVDLHGVFSEGPIVRLKR